MLYFAVNVKMHLEQAYLNLGRGVQRGKMWVPPAFRIKNTQIYSELKITILNSKIIFYTNFIEKNTHLDLHPGMVKAVVPTEIVNKVTAKALFS